MSWYFQTAARQGPNKFAINSSRHRAGSLRKLRRPRNEASFYLSPRPHARPVGVGKGNVILAATSRMRRGSRGLWCALARPRLRSRRLLFLLVLLGLVLGLVLLGLVCYVLNGLLVLRTLAPLVLLLLTLVGQRKLVQRTPRRPAAVQQQREQTQAQREGDRQRVVLREVERLGGVLGELAKHALALGHISRLLRLLDRLAAHECALGELRSD
mmetsp:Transcript_39332/g.97467  ORF Transcript_39332/g.97467 Transcript_39332/m.97467 type:complete len:213 (+) Transcript_39332:150-788(+)